MQGKPKRCKATQSSTKQQKANNKHNTRTQIAVETNLQGIVDKITGDNSVLLPNGRPREEPWAEKWHDRVVSPSTGDRWWRFLQFWDRDKWIRMPTVADWRTAAETYRHQIVGPDWSDKIYEDSVISCLEEWAANGWHPLYPCQGDPDLQAADPAALVAEKQRQANEYQAMLTRKKTERTTKRAAMRDRARRKEEARLAAEAAAEPSGAGGTCVHCTCIYSNIE